MGVAGGFNGLDIGFRADQNARANKFTTFVKSKVNASTQGQQYVAVGGSPPVGVAWNPLASGQVPAGPNDGPVLGVSVEHFVEPNYFVPQGTDPSTVTGTAPTLYNLQNRGLTLRVNGIARCVAAGPINQGAMVNVADQYGRVKAVNESSGTTVYPVGIAMHNVSNVNDVLQVELNFSPVKV